MATTSQESFPNIWRVLGLGVAAGYAGLGSYAMFMPITSATEHGLRPKADPESDKFVKNAMAWIGVRDMSIAAALLTFYYQGKPAEMGVVIMSGMIMCAADVVLVYRHRQDFYPFMLAAGSAFWGWIGWNLLQL